MLSPGSLKYLPFFLGTTGGGYWGFSLVASLALCLAPSDDFGIFLDGDGSDTLFPIILSPPEVCLDAGLDDDVFLWPYDPDFP